MNLDHQIDRRLKLRPGTGKSAYTPAAALTLCALLLSSTTVVADSPTPTSSWTDFYGPSVTFDGQAAPVGSIIEAFDPQGVLCGQFFVSDAGSYGFMPVYGDDDRTAGLDEGAVAGDNIIFTINGLTATTLGPADNTWSPGPTPAKELNLSASGAVYGLLSVELPADAAGAPTETINFRIGFQNTGNVTDFYNLEVTSNLGWQVTTPSTPPYVYAGLGTQYIEFSITIPASAFGDAADLINYTLTSGLEPSLSISGTLAIFNIATGVDDEDRPALPGSFALGQNYPNPFNPTTKIPFDLPRASELTLTVYDILGRKVSESRLGGFSAGYHVVSYAAEELASGIYYYKITAGEFSSVKRMILLK